MRKHLELIEKLEREKEKLKEKIKKLEAENKNLKQLVDNYRKIVL